jgi:hypothetical protein
MNGPAFSGGNPSRLVSSYVRGSRPTAGSVRAEAASLRDSGTPVVNECGLISEMALASERSAQRSSVNTRVISRRSSEPARRLFLYPHPDALSSWAVHAPDLGAAFKAALLASQARTLVEAADAAAGDAESDSSDILEVTGGTPRNSTHSASTRSATAAAAAAAAAAPAAAVRPSTLLESSAPDCRSDVTHVSEEVDGVRSKRQRQTVGVTCTDSDKSDLQGGRARSSFAACSNADACELEASHGGCFAEAKSTGKIECIAPSGTTAGTATTALVALGSVAPAAFGSAASTSVSSVGACTSAGLIGPSEEKKLHHSTVAVTTADESRTAEGEFLNDSCIDMFLRFTHLRALTCAYTRGFVYMFGSFLFKKLMLAKHAAGGDMRVAHRAVRRWSTDVDIFAAEFVMIPICGSLHWSLAIICHLPALAAMLQSEHDKRVAEAASREACLRSDRKPAGSRSATVMRDDDVSEDSDYPDNAESAVAAASVIPPRANSEVCSLLCSTGSDDSDCEPATCTAAPDGKPVIIHLDSLSYHNATEICSDLRAYVLHEWEDKRNGGRPLGQAAAPEPSSDVRSPAANPARSKHREFEFVLSERMMPGPKAKVPQQDNSCDCGVFVLKYAWKWCDMVEAANRDNTRVYVLDTDIRRNVLSTRLVSPDWFEKSDVVGLRAVLRMLIAELRQPEGSLPLLVGLSLPNCSSDGDTVNPSANDSAAAYFADLQARGAEAARLSSPSQQPALASPPSPFEREPQRAYGTRSSLNLRREQALGAITYASSMAGAISAGWHAIGSFLAGSPKERPASIVAPPSRAPMESKKALEVVNLIDDDADGSATHLGLGSGSRPPYRFEEDLLSRIAPNLPPSATAAVAAPAQSRLSARISAPKPSQCAPPLEMVPSSHGQQRPVDHSSDAVSALGQADASTEVVIMSPSTQYPALLAYSGSLSLASEFGGKRKR